MMRSKDYRGLECIAFVAGKGDIRNSERIEKMEMEQEKYIRRYAKAHGLKIVGVVHGSGLGQYELNKKINQVISLIQKDLVQGLITINMKMIACDLVDAYCKVGKVRSAGGEMITVEEGRLRLNIWRNS